MARVNWKEGKVISITLKDGCSALAQMMVKPYLAFFDCFSDTPVWSADAADSSSVLFHCSVVWQQFSKHSHVEKVPQVQPNAGLALPSRWIEGFHGSRRVKVWEGTPEERSFLMLSARPGGQLVEGNQAKIGMPRVIVPSIPLDDDETIDNHELARIGLYPHVNERLFLCKELGRSVDPLKDLTFGRPMRKEYATYVDILTGNLSRPEDLGYSSEGFTPEQLEAMKRKYDENRGN